jgi:hypothetical protein
MDAQCKGHDNLYLCFIYSIDNVRDEDSPFRDIALKCLEEGVNPSFAITIHKDAGYYLFVAYTMINSKVVEIRRQRISEYELYEIYDIVKFSSIRIA